MSVAVTHDYSKTAFDDALQHHFTALLSFACQSNFSGENLVFLHLVREWKAAWMTNRHDFPNQTTKTCKKCLQRQLFNVGVEMFYDFIDPETARFALNLDHSLFTSLRSIFKPAVIAMRIPRNRNIIAPFSDIDFESNEVNYASTTFLSSFSRYFHVEWACSPSIRGDEVHCTKEMVITNKSMLELKTSVPTDIKILESFGPSVFDDVANSVYLTVFRDTFPKFVNSCVRGHPSAPAVHCPHLAKVKDIFSILSHPRKKPIQGGSPLLESLLE
jgi:hypothetical protein